VYHSYVGKAFFIIRNHRAPRFDGKNAVRSDRNMVDGQSLDGKVFVDPIPAERQSVEVVADGGLAVQAQPRLANPRARAGLKCREKPDEVLKGPVESFEKRQEKKRSRNIMPRPGDILPRR
jgi:hypothetical protein